MAATPKGPQKVRTDYNLDKQTYDDFVRLCSKKGFCTNNCSWKINEEIRWPRRTNIIYLFVLIYLEITIPSEIVNSSKCKFIVGLFFRNKRFPLPNMSGINPIIYSSITFS